MPEPIQIMFVLSVILAAPALAMAAYHAFRAEKHIQCSREHPCEKGKPPS
ncbi:hypothetical protein [Sphingobium cupriresistens]